MCDTKSVLTVGVLAAAAFTGGAALGAVGGTGSILTGMSTTGLVASGITATAGLAQAAASYSQAEAQQEIASQNADIARAQAQDALQRGYAAEDRVRAEGRIAASEQRAVMAAKGGVVGVGTNDVMATQATYYNELDALNVRRNAALEAWGYTSKADSSEYQAKLYGKKKTNDLMGSILTTGAAAYGIYK